MKPKLGFEQVSTDSIGLTDDVLRQQDIKRSVDERLREVGVRHGRKGDSVKFLGDGITGTLVEVEFYERNKKEAVLEALRNVLDDIYKATP
jgi:hypothetical protein